jgi:gluconate 2-dehydrogenase gamma chain
MTNLNVNIMPLAIFAILKMKKTSNINRRDLLLGASPTATLMILGAATTDSAIAQTATTAVDYAPTFFTAVEWNFINAAVGRLIPSDGPGPGGLETGVPEFIDRQMELPYGHGAYFYLQGPFQPDAPATLGYQLRYTPRELYRSGIAAANDACRTAAGKIFADLAPDEQDRFLSSLEKNQVQLSGPPAAAFFAQLLENTREGYFADPLYGGNRGMAAWKWIGFPGARADFTDWIDQAGRKYPYGPVAISGARD